MEDAAVRIEALRAAVTTEFYGDVDVLLSHAARIYCFIGGIPTSNHKAVLEGHKEGDEE